MFSSTMVLMNFSHELVAMFTFLVLLWTVAPVAAYLFCAMAGIAHRSGQPMPSHHLVMACGASAFCLWGVIGAGEDAVYRSFVLLIPGVPPHGWQVRHARSTADKAIAIQRGSDAASATAAISRRDPALGDLPVS